MLFELYHSENCIRLLVLKVKVLQAEKSDTFSLKIPLTYCLRIANFVTVSISCGGTQHSKLYLAIFESHGLVPQDAFALFQEFNK